MMCRQWCDPPQAWEMLFREESHLHGSHLHVWDLRVSCYDGLVNTQGNLLTVENPDCKYCLLLENL